MKKLLFSISLLVVFVFMSCEKNTKQEDNLANAKQSTDQFVCVGIINQNGIPVVNFGIPEHSVLNNWEANILRDLNTVVALTSVSIQYNNDVQEFNDIKALPGMSHLVYADYEAYAIESRTADGSFKTAYEAHEENGNIYVRVTGPKTTVTCAGCMAGCHPKQLGSAYICYPQCPAGTSECIKTETVVIGEKLDVFGTNYISL